MAIAEAVERLGTGSPDGCYAQGLRRNIIQSQASTRTLLAKESGSIVVFDSAAGHVFTLPSNSEGLWFEFFVATSVTSNAHKIITSAATEFLLGGVIMGDVTVAQSGDFFTADGSTIRALSADGATKGGLVGERYVVTCATSTIWTIHGVCHGAGTLATPFATS